MPARVNTVAGGPRGTDAAAIRRRTQAQDRADEPGGAGRANAPGGGGRTQAAGRAGGGDRVEISNAARNAQQGAATPREAQGRRQPVEQGRGVANEEVRARRGGRPEPNARPAEARRNAGGEQRVQRAEAEQANAARARRPRNPGRNVGTRIDVAG